MALPIGLFMPLPLAMMIPFMGIQSAVMAKQFGENFQYGKRRISAMTNEDFNKLTVPNLQARNAKELRDSIPAMEEQIRDMRGFQTFIVKEFIEMLSALIREGLELLLPGDVVKALKLLNPNLFDEPPPDIGVPPPTEIGKLHLTLSEISSASDLVLLAWIRNINDYDAQTQQWLINERERRKDKPDVEKPSPPQEDSKLDPKFVATLTKSDLEKGGKRTRNYKGKLQHWEGVNKISYDGRHFIEWKWTGHWNSFGGTQIIKNNWDEAYRKINRRKRNVDASYVLEFPQNSKWHLFYLIKG